MKKKASITGCILFVALFGAGLLDTPAFAYEALVVHVSLADYATQLLQQEDSGSQFFKENNPAFLGQDACWFVYYGAWREDQYDYVYDIGNNTDLPPYTPTVTHFWDADNGPTDPVTLGAYGPYPNAFMKALKLWSWAVGAYNLGEAARPAAYIWLGHVAHLLADMSVNAHVHEDMHPSSDLYEDTVNWSMSWLFPVAYDTAQAGGLIEIPEYEDMPLAIQTLLLDPRLSHPQIERGVRGLYYLMYTTNQYADWFGSDDAWGDPNQGLPWGGLDWVPYGSLPDYFWIYQYPDSLGLDGCYWTAEYWTVPYAMRATATLYQLFLETVGFPSPANTLPTVDTGPDVSLDEGGTLNSSGSFSDPDPGNTWGGTVDYGDGLGFEPMAVNQDNRTFVLEHLYSDNGVFTVTVVVADDQDGAGSDQMVVTVQNVVPTVDAGSDVTILDCESVVLEPAQFVDPGMADTHTAAIDWGDGVVEPGAVTESAETAEGTVAGSHMYSHGGIYTVTVTVTDDDGGVGMDSLTVTVLATPPDLTVPEDIVVEQATRAGTTVTWVCTATDVCDEKVDIVCSPASGTVFPLGETVVTCTATDPLGNSTTKTFTVTVVDTTPPTIVSVTATPDSLWPVNHMMKDVLVAVEATDICDAAPVSTIVDVSSNEPVNGRGDGNTQPDWEITGALSVQLRAERSGRGGERVYTIQVECTDASGNTSASTVEVNVPHDRSGIRAGIRSHSQSVLRLKLNRFRALLKSLWRW